MTKIAGAVLALSTAFACLALPATAQSQLGGSVGLGDALPVEQVQSPRFRDDDFDDDFRPRRHRGGEFRGDFRDDGFRRRGDGIRDFGGPGRQAGGGSVCITSRGSCDAGFRAPHNTPCRCFIPGFGPKRGNIM